MKKPFFVDDCSAKVRHRAEGKSIGLSASVQTWIWCTRPTGHRGRHRGLLSCIHDKSDDEFKMEVFWRGQDD